MRNVFWVIEDSLAGRCGPTREPWSLAELHAAGFRAVLNLSEHEPAAREFAISGVDVAWVPLPNSCPADQDTEQACLAALPAAAEFVEFHLEAGRKVLVHCVLGQDRTGLVLAHQLVRSSRLTPEAAITEVRRVCPKALSAPGWEQMAERVIAECTRRPTSPASGLAPH